ncbi:pantoate--beta-alanine ligase [Phaeovulum sp.]|uniref:pantoate--beta-alanine ligase n=1 Tax=Phaeovulum sp. TaxID=2934796 RepID=UPI0039E3F1B7
MTAIIRTGAALRDKVAGWKRAGALVGVVPTMGALHDGHLSLARAARASSDRVIVTVFVNPKQFNNPNDLANYPKTEAQDLALLKAEGVDVLFAPGPDEVYPAGFATTVSVAGVSEPLEGAHRPGHFDGVATVVSKLFGMTQAGRAFFGEKDWQQLQVVRRLVADLNIPIQIIGCPTIRESDGLAMSSRNVRLTTAERAIAPALQGALQTAAKDLRAGLPAGKALAAAAVQIISAGFANVEYLELRAAEGLAPLTALTAPARLLVAAQLGEVRLIDNIPV